MALWGLSLLLISPIIFADKSLHPSPAFTDVTSFGSEEGEDSISISAPEKDWAQLEAPQTSRRSLSG
ncbi:hypothetical protein M9458_033307, partial [Cirrhinus mrigala]